MRNFKSILSLFTLGCFLLMTACNTTDPTPSKQEMISKDWKVSQVWINGSVDQSSDYSSFRYQFSKNGTYKFTLANGSGEQGNWELASNDQKIILNKAMAYEQTVQILSIGQKEMELEFILPRNFKSEEKAMQVKLNL